MSFSFWNNPIVVSAFRVKHRRGGMFGGLTAYLMLLVGLGFALPRFGFTPPGGWPLLYLITLVSIQCLLSGVMAGSATWNSLRLEVTQHTLDFQRVALPPRDILLGKMLGAPATAYLMALSTVPLALLSAMAAGVSPGVTFFLFLNVATSIVLCGAWGLRIHAERPDRSPGRGFTVIVCFGMYLMAIGFGGIGNMLSVPWAAVPVGLLTPLPVIYGVATQEPTVGLKWFGFEVPFLFVTPVWQMLVVGFFFHSMVRHLRCPMNPPFSKLMVYGALTTADLVTAGVLFNMGAWDLAPGPRAAAFCLVHMIVALLLLLESTPDKDALHSWVWRFRGKGSVLLEAFRGDRSPIGLMLLTSGAIGVVNLVLLVLVPAGFQQGFDAVRDAAGVIIVSAGTMALLICAGGMLLQVLLFEAGPDGAVALWILLLPSVAVPHIAGAYFQLPWLLALSPSAWFSSWISDDSMVGPGMASAMVPFWPLLLLLYGSLLAGLWLYLRVRLQQMQHQVNQKLRAMGVGSQGTGSRDQASGARSQEPGIASHDEGLRGGE